MATGSIRCSSASPATTASILRAPTAASPTLIVDVPDQQQALAATASLLPFSFLPPIVFSLFPWQRSSLSLHLLVCRGLAMDAHVLNLQQPPGTSSHRLASTPATSRRSAAAGAPRHGRRPVKTRHRTPRVSVRPDLPRSPAPELPTLRKPLQPPPFPWQGRLPTLLHQAAAIWVEEDIASASTAPGPPPCPICRPYSGYVAKCEDSFDYACSTTSWI